MAIASLVLGIISIMCSISIPGFQWCGIILAVLGILLSAKNKEAEQASLAKAGKVCCIIGLVLCSVLMFLYLVLLNVFGTAASAGVFEELASLLRKIQAYYFG